MGKRNIVSFELLDSDQDIAEALAGLPRHMTKSGLIRLALRAYLSQDPVDRAAALDPPLELNLEVGDVVSITQREVSDEQLDDLLDNVLGGW